jgi:hypothetical protein
MDTAAVDCGKSDQIVDLSARLSLGAHGKDGA